MPSLTQPSPPSLIDRLMPCFPARIICCSIQTFRIRSGICPTRPSRTECSSSVPWILVQNLSRRFKSRVQFCVLNGLASYPSPSSTHGDTRCSETLALARLTKLDPPLARLRLFQRYQVYSVPCLSFTVTAGSDFSASSDFIHTALVHFLQKLSRLVSLRFHLELLSPSSYDPSPCLAGIARLVPRHCRSALTKTPNNTRSLTSSPRMASLRVRYRDLSVYVSLSYRRQIPDI